MKASITLMIKFFKSPQWSVILLELSITNAKSMAAVHLKGLGAVVGTKRNEKIKLNFILFF